MRIGLLGGSFNPAHRGHRRMSEVALAHLGLHAVWWLVSPQNPLKDAATLADYEARLAAAREAARHPRIVVSDLEARLGTRYTIDTLTALKRRHPGVAFVWLMGEDNLPALHRWRRWRAIFATFPVAVIARPGYGLAAAASRAAQSFSRARIPASRARGLANAALPAWTLIVDRPDPASATAIRRTGAWPPA
ncbi:MAG: nicotinate-nucleotide adenylyltransferase [Alphaproteobacteria bacterium]|nr:nicotinate-nucleotide adenylyltransferase [Alphaproteobacteria bacterium]